MIVSNHLANTLTEQQREAILHQGGPLLIIAGPGSGKTEVIAWRVAHLIMAEHVHPENVLVTTFTNKAALELKDRIQRKLPQINVELMQVSTIHSFCVELLRKYRQHTIYKDFQILDEVGQFLFVYANRKRLGLDAVIKGRPYYFFSDVVRTFNLATEELVDSKGLEAWCEKSLICCCSDESDLWKERKVVAEAYGQYLELLTNEGLVDFALLQRYALELLKDNPSVLAEVQEQYQEILVDEYQDTNAVQDQIISLLAGKDGKHLTVVGDDDQSIYRFRGATVCNIITFRRRFPEAKLVKMEHNFRSFEPIVDKSKQVISHNPVRIMKDLFAVRGIGSDTLLVYKHTVSEEAEAVVDLLKRLYDAGKISQYNDVAILLRSVRYHAEPYITAMQKAGIPYNISGDASFFQRQEIKQLYELLIFLGASKPWGDKYLRLPLVGLRPETCNVLQAYSENLMDAATEEGLHALGIYDKADLRKLLDLLELKRWIKDKKHISLLEVFYKLIEVIGLVALFEQKGDEEALMNLGLLSSIFADWDEYGRTRNFYPFLQYLKLIKEGGVNPANIPLQDAIQVMTIHQAKGLEFPVVILGSALNGRLPSTRHKDRYEIPYDLRASTLGRGKPEVDDPHMVDERKLFYVAATRARDLLIVGTADVINKRGGGPSVFLKEMFGDDLHAAADLTKAYIEAVESQRGAKIGPRPRHSFSQLALFLQCPIRYKFAVVYGLQPPWLDPIGFGANVHRALEAIHRRAIEGRIPTEEEIPAIVAETWVSSGRTKPEREKKYRDAAIKQIRRYLQEHGDYLSAALQAEVSFSFALDDHIMLGKIDLLKEGEGGCVEVVDFKTSKMPPEEGFKAEGIDLQLDIYALGTEDCFECRVDKTTAHFLTDGQVEPRSWSQTLREEGVAKLRYVLNCIAEGEFSPNRLYCDKCQEFSSICPYFTGFIKGERL